MEWNRRLVEIYDQTEEREWVVGDGKIDERKISTRDRVRSAGPKSQEKKPTMAEPQQRLEANPRWQLAADTGNFLGHALR